MVYPLYTDIVSKYIFGTQENVRFLEDLLESVLEVPAGSLKGLKVLNSVKITKDIVHNKDFEMDILAQTLDGEIINVEFYSKYGKDAEIKNLMYISKTFANQLNKGDSYRLAKKVSQINFVKNITLHNYVEVVNKYIIINEKYPKDSILPDLFQIYIIDMDKKDKNLYNISERLRDWLELIKAESIEDMEKAVMGKPILEEALIEMKKFSKNKWMYGCFNRDRLIKSEHESELIEAEQKSFEKGLNNRNIEIAKKMLQMGLSISDISEATDLSKEEILKLQENKEA